MDCVKMAFESIWDKKIRSLLTMLGIIIGVGSVLILVSVVQGYNADLTAYYEKLQQFHIRVQSDILIKERGENSDGSNENTRNYPCRFTRWNESIRNKQSHADR